MSAASPGYAVAILLSGRGSNMRALVEHSRAAHSPFSVSVVMSDQPAAPGLEWAKAQGIATEVLPAAPGVKRAVYDAHLAAALEAHQPALVVLAGFMRILSPGFVERFAGRILNIHPSLLPKYPGLDTHRRMLAAGDAEHGATVHFVTEELDGGPRIVQGRIPVHSGETEDSVAARLIRMEHRIYPLAVSWFCQGRLACRDGFAWLDGERLIEPVQIT